MNTDDINLAYKIRHALNENLDALPAATSDRLAAARARALSRKKADARGATRPAKRPFFNINALFTGPALARLAVAAPILALVIGMGGVYQYEQQERMAAMAEIDAAVLADELPLTAYLDQGFNVYVESQQRQQ
ncbi:DUF3619 family protein [Telluria aromaticivorans]|uniref:DUF3619 family protein n=1 Tax=Telluria aromaticivorans TaxID=2725995 RepID=A0A7Y2JWX3_9BURK|nr:DUF3619 family protein [Telluria aromaticivorans]NNG22223.1 DUF3619 family protein [Telluria aromaticivorans]